MLIHVTRFTAVQREVAKQVEAEFGEIRNAVRYAEGGVLQELRDLWQDDFVPTTLRVSAEIEDPDILPLAWDQVEQEIPGIVEDIWIAGIRQVNGSAKDVLDYDVHKDSGLSVIAVGGDKLSRGLTLEGLTVSYFLRAAKMYDTLMQMGRWFGYRPGYLDLCRLYTTEDLEEWFQHITEASEELRQEFDHMHAIGGTPRQYGLRVKAHPVLMVTSRVKMRNHATLQISFAGSMKETVVFHRDTAIIRDNFRLTERLLTELGDPCEFSPKRDRPEGTVQSWKDGYLWSGIPGAPIVNFIEDFITHPDAVKVDHRLLADYVRKQIARGELVDWTVALLSGEGEDSQVANLGVKLIRRRPNERCYSLSDQRRMGRYIIRRLIAPRDEAIDLDLEDYQLALDETVREWQRDPGRSKRRTEPTVPSGPAIRSRRPERRGLLLLYPLDPSWGEMDEALPIMGFAISFPESPNAEKVVYEVNNIYWAQEFGTEETS